MPTLKYVIMPSSKVQPQPRGEGITARTAFNTKDQQSLIKYIISLYQSEGLTTKNPLTRALSENNEYVVKFLTSYNGTVEFQ